MQHLLKWSGHLFTDFLSTSYMCDIFEIDVEFVCNDVMSSIQAWF